jgi:type IV secretion system protein VirD4
MMILIQDLSQVYATYGREAAKSFINNKVRVAFAQNDYESAELISKWIGDTTVEQHSQNRKNAFLNEHMDMGSQTINRIKKALISPAEIMRLNKDKMIITVEGAHPILGKKVIWYQDANLLPRGRGAINIPTITPVIIPFDRSNLVEPNQKNNRHKKEQSDDLAVMQDA